MEGASVANESMKLRMLAPTNNGYLLHVRNDSGQGLLKRTRWSVVVPTVEKEGSHGRC